jgi:hypothetical protein
MHAPEEPAGLSALLPDPDERRRYVSALRRLAMRPVTPARLAERAKLKNRLRQVRAAIRSDPRFARVREPLDGPERYALRPEYRHTATLAREAHA